MNKNFETLFKNMTREEGIDFLHNNDDCPGEFGLENNCKLTCIQCIKLALSDIRFKGELEDRSEMDSSPEEQWKVIREDDTQLTLEEELNKYKELVALLNGEIKYKVPTTSIYNYMEQMRPDLYRLVRSDGASK